MMRSLVLGVSAAVLLAGAAQAADLYIPSTPQPIVESAGFNWEGLYIGVQGGLIGSVESESENDSAGLVGLHVGTNFLASGSFLLGLEGTAEYIFSDYSDSALFLINGRAGFLVTDDVLLYGIAGAGVLYNVDSEDSTGVYQLGLGAEIAVSDNISLRGQVAGLGGFDDANDDLFDSYKATVGLSFHF